MNVFNKIMFMALLCTGVALGAFGQEENQELTTPIADTSQVTVPVQSDTTAPAELDSSGQDDKPAGSVLSTLIKPILLTGIVGGLLLLLYTQRGS